MELKATPEALVYIVKEVGVFLVLYDASGSVYMVFCAGMDFLGRSRVYSYEA